MPRRARRILLTALVGSAGLAVWNLIGLRESAPRVPHVASVHATSAPASAPGPTAAPGVDPAIEARRDPAIVAVHDLAVDQPLIAIAREAGEPATLRRFSVRLGPGRFADIDVGRFEAINDDEGLYVGSVRGQRDSQAIFSYVGLAHAGTVVLPAEERAFSITATEDGRMRITELDLTRAPLCGQPLLAQGPPPVN